MRVPKTRAARRAAAPGGRAPRYSASPPLKRTKAEPSESTSAESAGAGVARDPARQALANRNSPADAARRGQTSSAASADAQDAGSSPLQGRTSTDAHGRAAAWKQTLSKTRRPHSTPAPAAGATAGSQASAPHSRKPPANSGPDRGTRTILVSGPIKENRPNTSAHSGANATATARPAANTPAAPRTRKGQRSGRTRSTRALAASTAAHAATLIMPEGESAPAGSSRSSAAAAAVRQADAGVSRPSRRASTAAASISQARAHGGSPPAIKV